MLIKVSHESPISIIDYSQTYNDFDYALVHLFETKSNYYNYFKTARNIHNREVLLDNSIFELGTAFNRDKFFQAALDIQPNMFIVPDVLEDSDATIDSYINFRDQAGALKSSFFSRAIGAIQGKNWQDLKDCYEFMSNETDMIAISFDLSYYQVTGEGHSKLEKFCSGRKRFISQLIDCGLWNWNKPHHLLGCSLAKEFRFYVDKNIYNIVSCDTSNPVVAAIHGLKYDADYGIPTKPTTKLADLIDHELTPTQLNILNYNVNMFKKIIRR
jgi:hypothetical protein